MAPPHVTRIAVVASAIVSVCLLSGCSAGSSAPASSRPLATASSGDVSIEGNGAAGDLAALVPLTPPGLSYDSDGTAGISTNQFQQLGLESWHGVVGCDDADQPVVRDYAAFEFTDVQTNRHGAASVFLYRLADAEAGAAWYAACNASATSAVATIAVDGITTRSVQTSDGPVDTALVGNVYVNVSGTEVGVDRSTALFRTIVENAAKDAKTAR